MEVRFGVIYSPKELVVETEEAPDELSKKIEAAVDGKQSLLWLTDAKGRRVAIPTDKLAYVEIDSEAGNKRVGFGG